MSIPRKHHYIPQVHIRKFKTDDGYNVFRKAESKIINFKSSSQFFHIKDLNSSIDFDTKEIDHKTTEEEISNLWDSKFNYHYDALLKCIEESIQTGEFSKVNIQENLKFFFEYSIVGYLRRAKQTNNYHEKGFDIVDAVEEFATMLENEDLSELGFSSEENLEGISFLRNFANEIFNESKHFDKLKYPSPTVTEAKMLVPNEVCCDIFVTFDSRFNLPDCTAFIKRSAEVFEYMGTKLNKITYIGLPLSPNIYLQIKDNDLVQDKTNGIYLLPNENVDKIGSLPCFCSLIIFRTGHKYKKQFS